MSRHTSLCGGFLFRAALRFFELAGVLVRFDHVARCIVNVLQGRSHVQSAAPSSGASSWSC